MLNQVAEPYENIFHNDIESEENEENEEDDESQINIDLHVENSNVHVINNYEDRRNEVSPIIPIICLFIMSINITLFTLPIPG